MNILSEVDERFSCRECGKCCTTPWKVKVGDQRAQLIRRTEAFAKARNRGYVPLNVVSGQAQMARKNDSTCVFLNDGGCDIHRELGGFSKPTVCQLYPFSLVNTPDGYYLSLMFSCPSVVEAAGVPLVEHIPSIRRTVAESEFYTGLPMDQVEIPLTPGSSLSWPAWKELEPEVLQILKVRHGVAGAARLAASIVGHSRNPHSDWRPTEFLQSDLEQIVELLPLYSSLAVAVADGVTDSVEQNRICDLLLFGEPYMSQRLKIVLPELHFAGPANDRAANTIDRFLHNFVMGKRILQDGTVLSRTLALGVSLAVLNYYHSAVEELLPESRFPNGTLAWAFDLVETVLLGHSDGAMGLFRDYEHQVLRTLGPASEV